MVVPMNPCRRRGGLWWRMDARSAGEENRGNGENRGRWGRNAGKGENEGKGVGLFTKQKPALGVPAIEIF